jgi:hypothetical protein
MTCQVKKKLSGSGGIGMPLDRANRKTRNATITVPRRPHERL